MKQPGEEAAITYAWKGDLADRPRVGDVLQTKTGRRYLILDARGGCSGGAMKLKCLIMDPDDSLPEGARVYPLHWNARKRRR